MTDTTTGKSGIGNTPLPEKGDAGRADDTEDLLQRYRHRGDLTQGPVGRLLFRMAAPMTWGIFALIGFQLVDIYFISRLGTEPLAALGFTMPVCMVVFSILMGLTIATSSVLARQIGGGDEETAIRISTHAVALGGIVGILITLFGHALLDPVFRLMGATDALMPYIEDFMEIWFLGSVFMTVMMIGNAAIRANGNTMFPALSMTAAALLNVALDPVLIFGWGDIPALGLKGAAIATVLSNLVAMAASLYMLGFRMRLLRFARFEVALFGDSVRRLCFIALPAGLTSMVQPVVNAITTAILAAYGTEAVAAFGIVTRVEAFAFVVLMGLAGGMAPILGQNWGARQFARVVETLSAAFRFSVGWAVVTALFLGLLAYPVARLFTQDAAVVKIAVLYFQIVPITYIAGNLVPGWSSAFNALGMPERSALMIFGKYILVQIPAILVGVHFFGVPGLFAGIALTNLAVGGGLHFLNWRLLRAKVAAA